MTTLLSSIPGIGYYFLAPDQRMRYDLEQCAQNSYVNGLSQGSDRADHLVKEAKDKFSDKPEVMQASDELVWLREVSKYPELMKVERLPTGKFGLKILPKALAMEQHAFNVRFFDLVNVWNYPVIFENRVYTSKAVMVALEQGKLSSPQDFVQMAEYTFRDGKKSTWTAAQIKSLRLKPDIDLSDVDESLFAFAYEAFVDCRHQDMAWWNQRTHEEVFRLRGFAKRFTERVEVPEFTLGSADIITIGEDRLFLSPDRFKQSMRDFLNVYPHCHFIRIEQAKEKYPLVFRRFQFSRLVDANIDPALIRKTYPIITKESEKTSVTSDIFFQILFQDISYAIVESQQDRDFSIRHSKQTLDHAIQYLKTGVIPLKWEDIKKLQALLNEAVPNSTWVQDLNDTFKGLEPHLSKTDLDSLEWKDLGQFLPIYLNQPFAFHAGPYVYSIRTIKDLIPKFPTGSPSLLAQPVWFLLRGEKVQGDLSLLQFYPKVLKEYPKEGTGELSNPIQFPTTELLFNESNVKPFIGFFRMLQSLRVFLQNFKQPQAIAFLDAKLKECSRIYIGDPTKKGRDYWIQVREELAKYPKASEVILDGCSQTWKRSVVEVFCEEGTLAIEDLNTAVLLKLSAVNTPVGRYEPVYHQISLAEWKCLSSSDPNIDRSGRSHPSERILIGDFLEVYGQVFKTREKKDLSTELHPFLKLLTPFALQKIDPKLLPLKRIFSTENSLFYAQRILAIFTAAIGGYLYAKSSPNLYSAGKSAVISLTALGLDPQGRQYLSPANFSPQFVLSAVCYIGGAAALGYGIKFLLSKRGHT
jgi:hypothetical protein